MKYYLLAGEASGDLHGSNLMKALKKLDAEAEFRFWGGDLMEAQGGTLVKHYKDLAFMGFIEVAKNIRTILNNLKFCKSDIEAYQPDAIIMVDYPGFNLRIAKWSKAAGFLNLYYISPQLWAWNAKRVKGIKANIDRMYVILPFEQDFYAKHQYEVDFVGHPLLDVVENYQAEDDFRILYELDERPIIALLPGSRRQEISKMLETMLAIVPDYPDYQFVIGGAPSIPLSFYENLIQHNAGKHSVKIVSNQTYALLHKAYAALVTSGTATLETALFRVPQVVCYKGNPIGYQIAKRLVRGRIKYIALANLIVDQPIVKELIQNDFESENLKQELNKCLQPIQRQEIYTGYDLLREKLGDVGASARAAKLMFEQARTFKKD